MAERAPVGAGPSLAAGIDEAGRGPVIGPLVLAAVWLDARAMRALRRQGVRDSKALDAGARERLAASIRQGAARVELEIAPAFVVDAHVRRGELNVLERRMAAAVLDRGPRARRILADGARLFEPLRERYPELRARDRADALHTAVAAASIVAKVERDRRFLRIAARCGSLADEARQGMGYVNAATERFLRAYWARHARLPPGTRRSWGWAPLRELTDRQLTLEIR